MVWPGSVRVIDVFPDDVRQMPFTGVWSDPVDCISESPERRLEGGGLRKALKAGRLQAQADLAKGGHAPCQRESLVPRSLLTIPTASRVRRVISSKAPAFRSFPATSQLPPQAKTIGSLR